jgi:hypothetical protein
LAFAWRASAKSKKQTVAEEKCMNAGVVILILKAAVVLVTLIWFSSLIALLRGNYRLHGRINMVFFVLTLAALLGLEAIIRIIEPDIFDRYFEQQDAKDMLRLHLAFSIPSAVLLFVMLFSGLKHYRKFHIATGILFSVLWVGTFITGVFFLPHELPW